jgi:hypothetical protein
MMRARKEFMLCNKKTLQLAAVLSACCSGCSRAPSVDILGSFFPAWMLCVSIGVAVAVAARSLLARLRLEKDIALPVLFYPSVAVAAACLLWLTLFR